MIKLGHQSTVCLDHKYLPPCRTNLAELYIHRGMLPDLTLKKCIIIFNTGILLIAQCAILQILPHEDPWEKLPWAAASGEPDF